MCSESRLEDVAEKADGAVCRRRADIYISHMGFDDSLDSSPAALRYLLLSELLKTCFSSVLQLSAAAGQDQVLRTGDAGRPRLDERNRLGVPSTAMCSAPTEVAAATIAVGAKGKVADPPLFLKLTVGGGFSAPRGVDSL